MKYSANNLDEERIELLDDKDQERFKKAKPLSVLNRIWQHLIAIFTKLPELQVKHRSDRFGNTWWEAYDPVTGRSASFGSETDMLAWIEARYYQ
jgi:hypothetical protein